MRKTIIQAELRDLKDLIKDATDYTRGRSLVHLSEGIQTNITQDEFEQYIQLLRLSEDSDA